MIFARKAENRKRMKEDVGRVGDSVIRYELILDIPLGHIIIQFHFNENDGCGSL